MTAFDLITAAKQNSIMLTLAESCTGGLIAAAITDIPGSSAVFDRGFVTYTNQSKMDLLSVSRETLAQDGAVSSAVAKQMANGAIAHSQADVGLSVTGIAGPGGGSDDKPVGTVWFGVCRRGCEPTAHHFVFKNTGRTGVRAQAVETGLSLLLDALRT